MSIRYAALSLATLMTGACAPIQLGDNWGIAYQTARQNQTLHPEAGESLDPVVGLDGKAGATAMETYRKSFEKPDAQMQNSLVSTGVQTR